MTFHKIVILGIYEVRANNNDEPVKVTNVIMV